jgi:hypothetical protein
MTFQNLFFFSGIDITNTAAPPPLQGNFASLCVLEPVFFRKIALHVIMVQNGGWKCLKSDFMSRSLHVNELCEVYGEVKCALLFKLPILVGLCSVYCSSC